MTKSGRTGRRWFAHGLLLDAAPRAPGRNMQWRHNEEEQGTVEAWQWRQGPGKARVCGYQRGRGTEAISGWAKASCGQRALRTEAC